MANAQGPFHPIIYVRGFAMSQGEIDDTTADPFCGFNLGSTVYRAVPDEKRPPRKFIFESPVVRLGSDFEPFNYKDVYEDGYDIVDEEWKPNETRGFSYQSIVIYRYYDPASKLLGVGEEPSIENFATRLGQLILRIREVACANPDNKVALDEFRCHLVAHSMGGLICRAFLQNPKFDPNGAAKFVDKLFTYATPHNGIDAAGINVPSWLKAAELNTFSRETMATYLDLKSAFAKTDSVDWIPEDRFPTENVFCMVGTNRSDYEAAFGAARTFVGHGSDGLVRIENATLCGLKANGETGSPAAKAFCYRSHSGFFGIVNSEEAFQNLIRFLFGDVRVDVWIDVESISLPPALQKAEDAGKTVNALYQFELLASPRGKLWYLTRRTAEEDSAACLSHAEWKKAPKKNGTMYVSSVFLSNRAKVKPDRPTLAYSLSFGVRVPDYEIERKLWIDEHYEGSYLYRNSMIVEITPPQDGDTSWTVTSKWQNKGVALPTAKSKVDSKKLKAGKIEVKIPFESTTKPGISGNIRFVMAAWNQH